MKCKNCGNEITFHSYNNYGWRHEEGHEPPFKPNMEICGKPEPVITSRMKWIVSQLRNRPDAIIKHRRDAFLEKSYYSLEWGGKVNEPFTCHELTNDMKKKLADAHLIVIVEERSIYSKNGKFVTTERDWGLYETKN